MKILFAASEARPFSASGGLADVAGSLPKAIRKRMVACRVISPLYSDISPELRAKMKYLTNFNVPLGWRNQYCGVFTLTVEGVVHYFIDNEYYFKRPGLYGYYDDAERYAFFSRAVLETIRHIDYQPDVLHLNDWQTALVPVYLSLFYRGMPEYQNLKTVFTIHNIQYQGKFGFDVMEQVFGIGAEHRALMQYDDCVNLLKAAIQLSDFVTTVSPTYAKEILTPFYSHGLDRMLVHHQGKLFGIINGIDYDRYNPETDSGIAAPFSASDLSGKEKDKQDLLAGLSMPYEKDTPVVGIVSRLVEHKGMDLIQHVFEKIIEAGYQVVLLGSGEYGYECFFREMNKRYPGRMAVTIEFRPALATKIYAGADLFLMPSKSEPCGLAQMIALRYGTIPVVRETGGLKDTVSDCSCGQGNGFTFASYNAHDMLNALYRAKSLYHKRDDWEALVAYAMRCDYSWGQSANQYLSLYRRLTG